MILDVFKKALLTISAIFIMAGCTNDKVDTGFLCSEDKNTTFIVEAPTVVPYCEPVACQQTIYGHLTDEWLERIDTSNVKLNHYIDEVEVEENLADVVDYNGQLATTNPISIPEYVGTPMKHILIVEFYQIK